MSGRAFLSVSDKKDIVVFAKELCTLGYEIISTGGTAAALEGAGIKVTRVSEVTGFPECLDGRVKTLHPAIHAGILAMRDNPEHMKQLEELNIKPIDIVAVNLYPFRQTIMKDGIQLYEAIENIDIGGPTMLRAAAKNYQDVAVIVDSSDYGVVIGDLREQGSVSDKTKARLCAKVFEHTAAYDALIADYLRRQLCEPGYPERLTLTFEKSMDLRYGENPHQSAAYYKSIGKFSGCLSQAVQLHGKQLSFNNIHDANGALELLREFGNQNAVVAVKHANPCGVAVGETLLEAYIRAHDADPASIYGGVVAINGEVEEDLARKLSETFLEIIVARSFTEGALEILTQKKNIRLLELHSINAPLPPEAMDMKKVAGGLLVQEMDRCILTDDLVVATERRPTQKQMQDLLFAFSVVKHVKSNAIVVAKDHCTLGIGPGQVNRIWAAQQALERSGEAVKGAVLASDAYFPFSDSVEAAAKAGISCIIQPGGSVRDQESIDACNKHGIAMVFTGVRHFKH